MKKKIITFLLFSVMIFSVGYAETSKDAQKLIDAYALQRHSEGGWFAEIYTSPFKAGDRSTAGSIYFLLDKTDVSHFHQIDCDEIWYYHAGAGMRIYVLQNGALKEHLLGMGKNMKPMAVIPAGAIFAAENIDKNGYTFISCATTPKFSYEGFRLITKAELKKRYPNASNKLLELAYEKV